MKKPRLNNMQMNFNRRDPIYQTVIIDLYLIGAISKEVAEALTDTEVMDNVKLPDAATALLKE